MKSKFHSTVRIFLHDRFKHPIISNIFSHLKILELMAKESKRNRKKKNKMKKKKKKAYTEIGITNIIPKEI